MLGCGLRGGGRGSVSSAVVVKVVVRAVVEVVQARIVLELSMDDEQVMCLVLL